MADLKIEKCCGVEPNIMVFQYVAVASCPVCGHRSFPIPLKERVLHFDDEAGKIAVECWNRGVRDERT